MATYEDGYNEGFAAGHQDAALIAVPVLRAIKGLNLPLPANLERDLDKALQDLWPFTVPDAPH